MPGDAPIERDLLKREHGLDLDPGRSRPRRKGPSGCKCLLVTIGVFAALLAVLGIGNFLSKVARGISSPHAFMYENKTLEEVEDLSKVVRPLVDEKQKFDIVGTVWVASLMRQVWDGEGGYVVPEPEEMVWSGVVFEGVTIMDKHVHRKVELKIPLEFFTEDPTKELTNYDLRASFILIPQDPSLLDYLTNFSSWRPHDFGNTVVSPTGRSTPWQRSLREWAIDSYGITIPLIELNEIKSSCDVPNEGQEVEWDPRKRVYSHKTEPVSTKGHPPLKVHPYVITRTDLRVARMTKLYNLKEYDAYRDLLRGDLGRAGCFRALETVVVGDQVERDERYCHRSFSLRGNAETKLELDVPAGLDGEKKKKQFAYAPFLDLTPRSWGPLDLVPLPIKREECSSEASESNPAPEYLNITWNLAYSSNGPARLFSTEILGHAGSYNLTDTEFAKAEDQFNIEGWQRVHGHKFSPDGRMGRKQVLVFAKNIAIFVATNLQILYWFTRSSTVGLSIIGSASLALSHLLGFISEMTPNKFFEKDSSIFAILYTLTIAVWFYLSSSLLVFKVLLRLEFVDSIPYFQRIPASHLERASSRLETRGRTRVLIAIAAAVLLFHIATPLREYPLISALGPPEPVVPWDLRTRLREYGVSPLRFAAMTYQLLFNYKSKTFAGRYKLEAWISLAGLLLGGLIFHIPWVAGSTQFRWAYTLEEFALTLQAVVWVVQATLYPKVLQDAEDKDDN